VALRRELRDLAVLLALPAMWVDQEPAEIAAGLLDVLFALFHLESGYVRFDDLTGGHALECWRPAGPQLPLGLEQALASIPGRKDGFGTLTVTTSSDDDDMRVTSICPTLPSEEGLILVGARRTDFPTEFE